MSTSLTGGCQCGAVRYECSAEPLFTGNCHCRDCQKATGGAYVPAFAVPVQSVKITGDVKYYEVARTAAIPSAGDSVRPAAAEFSEKPPAFRNSF